MSTTEDSEEEARIASRRSNLLLVKQLKILKRDLAVRDEIEKAKYEQAITELRAAEDMVQKLSSDIEMLVELAVNLRQIEDNQAELIQRMARMEERQAELLHVVRTAFSNGARSD